VKRSGFAFIEMLYVLAIMPIFMLVSTALFWSIMKTANATQHELSVRATFDAAAAQIWRDVFSAADIRSTSPGLIVITTRTGRHIQWRDDQSSLLRVAADQRTFLSPDKLRLHVELQKQTIMLQLIGPDGCEDQVAANSPAIFWRPS
jgi:type II secretory pathway component PulJ